MKRILITGGAGFVGSQFAVSFKKSFPRYRIVAFDNLRRAGSELNVARLREHGIEFLRGDIRNPEDFTPVGPITDLIECSAEPSVLAGLDSNPGYVINNNLLGSVNCLNFAMKHRSNFIFLSSSRVYPIANLDKVKFKEEESRFHLDGRQILPGVSERGISESFPMEGYRSLYGATKLASELLIEEYRRFYGLKTVVNRCGVIAGPWQMGKTDQGFLALWVAKHYWKEPLRYIGYGGTGKQVRDVLHIEDLFRLVDYELRHINQLSGEVFNVGGGVENSVSLLELTRLCRRLIGNRIPISRVAAKRPADVRIYVTDAGKVTARTGWKPKIGLMKIVTDTHRWMRENRHALERVLRWS